MLTNERGDTLIEVLFATAVLALIIVISLTIMNTGTSRTELAVEKTFVRQAIDSQSEMLRYERDSYVNGTSNIWSTIKARRINNPLGFSSIASSRTNCQPQASDQAFWLQADATQPGGVGMNTSFSTPSTYASPGYGMWISAAPNTTTNYVDFYIYACWDPPTGTVKSTVGTIVRVYAP